MKKLPNMVTTAMDLTGTNKKEASKSLWWAKRDLNPHDLTASRF